MNCFYLGTGASMFILSMVLLSIASLLIQVYGAYISFKAKWYLGAVALLVPGFAFVVGTFKLFKKDILT